MASDVMSVRLWLPRIKVEGSSCAPEELGAPPQMPRLRGRHDRRDDRDLEVSGRPVTLIWERRRLVCEPCGSAQGFEGRVTALGQRRPCDDGPTRQPNATR